MAEPMRCYRHPKRETRISCATCGRPICTECMVQTDVGIKCPDDARLPRGSRAGAMKPAQIAKTLLAGLVVALVGMLVAYAIVRIPGAGWLLSALAGYGAGTLIHRAGGRNGGPLTITVAVVSVTVAFSPAVIQTLLGAGAFPVQILIPAVFAIIAAIAASR